MTPHRAKRLTRRLALVARCLAFGPRRVGVEWWSAIGVRNYIGSDVDVRDCIHELRQLGYPVRSEWRWEDGKRHTNDHRYRVYALDLDVTIHSLGLTLALPKK